MSTIIDTNYPSKQIFINSDDADLLIDGEEADMIMYFSEYVNVPQNIDIVISVVDCQIPMSYYICTSKNNTLVYSYDGGAPQTITIAKGNYNINQLKSYLNGTTGFNGLVKVEYTDITNKVTFDAQAGHTIQLLTGTTCGRLIGFDVLPTAVAQIIVSDSVVDVSGISAIYVASNFLTRSLDSRTKSLTNILCKIPVTTASNGLLTYTNKTGFKTIIQDKNINFLHLTLEDEDRNIMELNKVRWILTLQLDFVYVKGYRPALEEHKYYQDMPNNVLNLPPPPNENQLRAKKKYDEIVKRMKRGRDIKLTELTK